MINKEETKQKSAALQAFGLNYNKEIPALLMKTWLKLLASYSAQQVERAVERVICEYEFKTLPPFAVLKKALDENAPGYVDPETLKAAAEAEWAKLREMVPRIGRYRTPTIESPTTAAVVRMTGGWSAQCDMYDDEKPFRHREFVELWVTTYGKEDIMLEGGESVLAVLSKNLRSQAGLGASKDALPVGSAPGARQ